MGVNMFCESFCILGFIANKITREDTYKKISLGIYNIRVYNFTVMNSMFSKFDSANYTTSGNGVMCWMWYISY